ncbi:hypothetical protein MPSEU_000904500 [Mayamaea pseudoterrestris]|nr:hypothetical protein MPSEU_000904500 [Mayamaea pseudoterrestris]
MPPTELSLALASFEWDRAVSIINRDPKQAKVWTLRLGFYEGTHNSELLPLHEACTGTAPPSVAQALLQAYPKAAQLPESAYQRLPLHCACRKHADAEIIDLLIDSFAEATLIPDSLGRLPIHYALSNGASDAAVIGRLLQVGPDCARGVGDRNWTPLHVACCCGASVGVVEQLLRLYPEAAVIRTLKGSSAAGLLNKKECLHWKQLYSLLMQAKDDFDRTFVDPFEAHVRKVEDLMLV